MSRKAQRDVLAPCILGGFGIPAVVLWESCRHLSWHNTWRSLQLTTEELYMAQEKHKFKENSVQQGLPWGKWKLMGWLGTHRCHLLKAVGLNRIWMRGNYTWWRMGRGGSDAAPSRCSHWIKAPSCVVQKSFAGPSQPHYSSGCWTQPLQHQCIPEAVRSPCLSGMWVQKTF